MRPNNHKADAVRGKNSEPILEPELGKILINATFFYIGFVCRHTWGL